MKGFLGPKVFMGRPISSSSSGTSARLTCAAGTARTARRQASGASALAGQQPRAHWAAGAGAGTGSATQAAWRAPCCGSRRALPLAGCAAAPLGCGPGGVADIRRVRPLQAAAPMKQHNCCRRLGAALPPRQRGAHACAELPPRAAWRRSRLLPDTIAAPQARQVWPTRCQVQAQRHASSGTAAAQAARTWVWAA